MNKIARLFVASSVLFALDRFTKFWALSLSNEWVVNKNLSCALTFNRGINWGLFNCASAWVFIGLTILISIVMVLLSVMTINAAKQGKSIVGYLLILTGAFSNFLDRIFYGGVIDFIVVWFGDWSWPAFNIADAAILVGIAMLLKDYLRK